MKTPSSSFSAPSFSPRAPLGSGRGSAFLTDYPAPGDETHTTADRTRKAWPHRANFTRLCGAPFFPGLAYRTSHTRDIEGKLRMPSVGDH
jgi:hypothetical protein